MVFSFGQVAGRERSLYFGIVCLGAVELVAYTLCKVTVSLNLYSCVYFVFFTELMLHMWQKLKTNCWPSFIFIVCFCRIAGKCGGLCP